MGAYAGVEPTWAAQTDVGRTHIATKGIVQSGLVLNLDAGVSSSYPGSGTTWTDLSGNGNNGSLVNGVGYSSGNGGSLSFDGSNDYVSFSFTNPSAETIIVWAKSATSTWNQYGWISSSRRQNGHIIHPSPGNKNVNMYFYNSSSSLTFIGSITPDNITIPHMYCITTNGSNSHKIYLDGEFISESTTSISRTTSPTNQVWYLGRDDYDVRYGNGNIYSALRYNRALASQEIQQNYNATKSRYI